MGRLDDEYGAAQNARWFENHNNGPKYDYWERIARAADVGWTQQQVMSYAMRRPDLSDESWKGLTHPDDPFWRFRYPTTTDAYGWFHFFPSHIAELGRSLSITEMLEYHADLQARFEQNSASPLYQTEQGYLTTVLMEQITLEAANGYSPTREEEHEQVMVTSSDDYEQAKLVYPSAVSGCVYVQGKVIFPGTREYRLGWFGPANMEFKTDDSANTRSGAYLLYESYNARNIYFWWYDSYLKRVSELAKKYNFYPKVDVNTDTMLELQNWATIHK